MIVEDNPVTCQTLTQAFQHHGYQTWTCPAPDAADRLFWTVQPNVVFLDIDFSRDKALQLIDEWHIKAPKTRLIVYSSQLDVVCMRDVFRLGATAFVLAPIAVGPLFDLLEKGIPTPAPKAFPVSTMGVA